MENNVVITDYTQMDRVLREEREYLLGMCKKIAKSGYVTSFGLGYGNAQYMKLCEKPSHISVPLCGLGVI